MTLLRRQSRPHPAAGENYWFFWKPLVLTGLIFPVVPAPAATFAMLIAAGTRDTHD